jgi:hypothetical protein
MTNQVLTYPILKAAPTGVGQSVYEQWLTLDGNAGKTFEQMIDEISGADGINGADGAAGKDGADGINGVDGAAGKDGADGINGVDGAAGKDGADGINGVDGATGKDGASAYEVWLTLGNVGTEQDFINALKAPVLKWHFKDGNIGQFDPLMTEIEPARHSIITENLETIERPFKNGTQYLVRQIDGTQNYPPYWLVTAPVNKPVFGAKFMASPNTPNDTSDPAVYVSEAGSGIYLTTRDPNVMLMANQANYLHKMVLADGRWSGVSWLMANGVSAQSSGLSTQNAALFVFDLSKPDVLKVSMAYEAQAAEHCAFEFNRADPFFDGVEVTGIAFGSTSMWFNGSNGEADLGALMCFVESDSAVDFIRADIPSYVEKQGA